MTTHLCHLKRIIGNRFVASEITQRDLRGYAVQRLSEKGRRGAKVSSVTVRKELNTLRTVWRWATGEGFVSKPLPLRGLKLPKTEEKLPFTTFSEVCCRIQRGGFSKKDENALWDSVFLPLPDLKELLAHVKGISHDTLLYPMIAFAAYTGVRRSEIIRSQLTDLSFDDLTVTVREKKRVPGQITTRRVPLAEELVQALNEWLKSIQADRTRLP
jgi:integrase